MNERIDLFMSNEETARTGNLVGGSRVSSRRRGVLAAR